MPELKGDLPCLAWVQSTTGLFQVIDIIVVIGVQSEVTRVFLAFRFFLPPFKPTLTNSNWLELFSGVIHVISDDSFLELVSC